MRLVIYSSVSGLAEDASLSETVFIVVATGALAFFSLDPDCRWMKASEKLIAIRIKAIKMAIRLFDFEWDFIKLHWLGNSAVV